MAGNKIKERRRKKFICFVPLHPRSLRRTGKVRRIPSDLRALHLKLFTVPSDFRLFTASSMFNVFVSYEN